MRTFAALGIFVFAAGCIKETRLMKLKADGSGTVTLTTMMNSERLEEMRQMMAAFGGGKKAPADPFSEEEAKKRVSRMGEGVEFVSAEKVKTADSEGIKAVYSYKDIAKLRLDQAPSVAGPGAQAQAGPRQEITFKFEQLSNGNSQLTIVLPEPQERPNAPDREPGDAEMAQIKEILKGMKFSAAIEFEGKIVKTNSPYVQGSTVTVFEMDIDALLADEAKFKEFIKKRPRTLEEMKQIVKDFPGFKVNVEKETTVEFK